MLPRVMADQAHQQIDPERFPPRVDNPDGASAVVLVCEHASALVPPEYAGLGLDDATQQSHIAWDPGAFETAKALSRHLDAPLVSGTVTRLIYDCNRPPEAPDAIVAQGEFGPVPGNAGLSAADRQRRIDTVYRPFEEALAQVLDARPPEAALVTIHSFTPVFRGLPRAVEIGILHDADSRLADALLQVSRGFRIERNAPYGPADGVTHTLKRHGLPRGLLNAMLEIRSDLIATPDHRAALAETLAGWTEAALARATEVAR